MEERDFYMQLELDLYLELSRIVGDATPVYLCGRPSSLSEVACLQIRERGRYTYMADVIRNEKGELQKVCYDKVNWS